MRIRFALILGLLAATAFGQSAGFDQEAWEKHRVKLRSWAKAYYPGVLDSKHVPKDLVLGFLVDKNGHVIKHSAGIKGPEGTAVGDELSRFFPGYSPAKAVEEGGSCLMATAHEPSYCVYFAVLK